jgi:hypothetical protein
MAQINGINIVYCSKKAYQNNILHSKLYELWQKLKNQRGII